MNNKTKRPVAMTITIIILVAVAALLLFAGTKPDSFRIERSITINASPSVVFPLINDFHQWTQWSPWEKKDPDLQRTYSGADSGKGAVYAWKGDNSVGTGKMEITESTPFAQIVIALDFIAPFEAHNTAIFTFMPLGDTTQVNWVMEGPNNFMSKLMQVFFSMDKMVGKDFESGLTQLKATAENQAGDTPPSTDGQLNNSVPAE
jgi:uncharacterized protein YndB with AHSA1/START domain